MKVVFSKHHIFQKYKDNSTSWLSKQIYRELDRDFQNNFKGNINFYYGKTLINTFTEEFALPVTSRKDLSTKKG